MPLNLRRLRRDVDARRSSETADGNVAAKPSGAMEIVRAHLGEIERLKAEGATWVAIAAALAEQGVRRRDGRPITGRHLTGLINSIRRQDTGRRKAAARRALRADVASESPPVRKISGDPPSPRSQSADAPQPNPAEPSQGHRTAEQIRREGLADLYDMLKGQKP